MTETVFFPGAGSFGGEFAPLTGPDARVARYPGRTGRSFGTPATSFDDLVARCAAQVTAKTPVLFGHSFGAYVAYAVAARIPVDLLVLYGATAPRRLRIPAAATRDPAATEAFLTAADPGMLTGAPSEEWREIIVETARQDLELLVQLDAAAVGVVSCPIVVIRGADDPLTPADGVGEWREHTTGSFSEHTVHGGHADLLRTPDAVSLFVKAGSR